MKIDYKELIKALSGIEDERRISEEVLQDALKEALAKAYKKDMELSDINIEVEINAKDQTIDYYQLYNVVENVEDDELEIELPDAREMKADTYLGDVIRRKVDIPTMSRAAATLARNVIRQKIREAEKIAVYDAYIDLKNEMVIGIVESVKEKFALINLGKTTALMPKSAQIPNERLMEGQKIRVVITEVNKESKGSQVLVSRADPMLVKRLFEKEVPEIAQGIVEIKAIAREAGERTKMAVVSYNPEIDPIGACIGQRGGRVQEIIEELKGEKIDIFLWSADETDLVRNALSPAEIEDVLPVEDDPNSLLVVVNPDQLSLAIGKKGKNAKLAVRLTDRKIDIKTKDEIIASGKDYDALKAKAEEQRAQRRKEIERRETERREAEARAAEEKRQAEVLELARKMATEAAAAAAMEDALPEEMQENMSERIRNEMAREAVPSAEPVSEPEMPEAEVIPEVSEEEPVKEAVKEPEPVTEPAQPEPKAEPEPEEVIVVKDTRKKKADLEEVAAKNDYVSRFEKLADTSKPKQTAPAKKRRRKGEEDNFKTRNDELLKQLMKDGTEISKPVYTEEELDEIERQQMEDEESMYDIDYDEYEEYYEE
ncbi:MAG: transcription termination/antitermination protein NusA [Solobacterium sp.]|nr:transcription termination/antitermination protein NusA [Solobacterium sp.]